MTRDPLYVLAVLSLAVALSEWLVRRTFLRHLGSALLVIVVVAVAANLGVVPVYSPDVPLYDGIFDYGVYIGVFWLLLQVSLADVRRAGGAMLFLFGAGAVGTMLGVFVGMRAIDGPATIGELAHAVGGMFAGTYIGGSANLNMVAVEYGVAKDGALYTGVNAVDAIMTTIWMVATIAIPRLLRRNTEPVQFFTLPRKAHRLSETAERKGDELDWLRTPDSECVEPIHLGVLLALGAGAYWASTALTGILNDALTEVGSAVQVPKAIVLTTLALALAQVPAIARLSGMRVLGMFAIYLFLAVIGTLCDLSTLRELGQQAHVLFAFAAIVIAVHGLVCFGAAWLFRLDWDVAAVASQANIGGGTSALALARSLGRADLVLPAILVGSLGTAAGTYLGILVAELLR